MKKIVIGFIIVSLFIITIYLTTKPKVIEKTYNGFYVNVNTKEIIKRCTIRLKIKHDKDSVDDNGKLLSYYLGQMFIDDKEYSIKGSTALDDELEYYKDNEGNKRISFESDDRSGIVYVFDLYERFNDETFHIGLQDRRFNPTVGEEIIATVKDSI
ncbi:MAG: hypothetical protein E7214_13735 [Clostridium sp.]|nr:hypothetical protein [Clostridium sp.]